MSLAHLKLNPAIARETPRGEVMCLVCSMAVKPKVWTAHIVGKAHRSRAEKLKKDLSNPKTATSAVKRAQEAAAEPAVPVKKAKTADGSELPEDFFAASGGSMDDGQPPPVETPWQRTRHEQNEIVRVSERKGLIEGLPQGFFDDKAKDMKVRETAEKEEQMDADYDKLMREIAEQDAEKEAVREREEDADTLRRELDNIDEQMERLQHLNDLEKKRDAILEGMKGRAEAAAERARAMEQSDEDNDDDDVDFDDWRSMNALR